MKKLSIALLVMLSGLIGTAVAERLQKPLRPVNTFSIAARDPATGELGTAVQSHGFSIGSIVIWAEPGVGAAAAQSFAEPSYGPLAFAIDANADFG